MPGDVAFDLPDHLATDDRSRTAKDRCAAEDADELPAVPRHVRRPGELAGGIIRDEEIGHASTRRLTCPAENGSPFAVTWPRSASSADVASNVRPSRHSSLANRTSSGLPRR